MQLRDKTAVVYGAAGTIGSVVARTFAQEGAHVHLVGRTSNKLEAVAAQIHAGGGVAETAVVDAFDRAAVDAHAASLAAAVGGIDISFNAIAVDVKQNVPLVDMPLEEFIAPIDGLCRTHFITATAAARQMTKRGSGVIIVLSATSAKEWRHEMGGFSPACAAIEAMTRSLAGEVGRKGVRVVGIRTNLNPETIGLTDDDVPELVRDTILGRLPRLSELAGTAVYLASDAAAAVTGVAVNMSCGAVFG
jgi:NAD(P)-dependent dehydrogenase (short-subunit alcohol dehydrogenase family)